MEKFENIIPLVTVLLLTATTLWGVRVTSEEFRRPKTLARHLSQEGRSDEYIEARCGGLIRGAWESLGMTLLISFFLTLYLVYLYYLHTLSVS